MTDFRQQNDIIAKRMVEEQCKKLITTPDLPPIYTYKQQTNDLSNKIGEQTSILSNELQKLQNDNKQLINQVQSANETINLQLEQLKLLEDTNQELQKIIDDNKYSKIKSGFIGGAITFIIELIILFISIRVQYT